MGRGAEAELPLLLPTCPAPGLMAAPTPRRARLTLPLPRVPAESECRGEPVRDFHQVQRGYAICQTTRAVSWVRCRGACRAQGQGQGCCTGLRLRRRKHTFECSDGSSFVDEVEKPSKCGCARCM